MTATTISKKTIAASIVKLRDHKVLLDRDLAKMYGIDTKTLKRAVRRNLDRFPHDFMFELTPEEWENLRYQTGTSSENHGGTRYMPFAFTEQGVAMLSSVLKSPQAVAVNISIMRTFVKLREWANEYAELKAKIEALQSNDEELSEQIAHIHQTIQLLLEPQYRKRNPIGFKPDKGK